VMAQPPIIVMRESGRGPPPGVSRQSPDVASSGKRNRPHDPNPIRARVGLDAVARGCPGCELAGASPNPPVLHVMGWGGGRRGCAGTRTG